MLLGVREGLTEECTGKSHSGQKGQFEQAPGGMKINLENVSGRHGLGSQQWKTQNSRGLSKFEV